MLLPSAAAWRERLGGRGSLPARGTGPLGAPGGGRWVTADDVLAWGAREGNEVSPHWSARGDPIRLLPPAPATDVVLRPHQLSALAAAHDQGEDLFRSGVIALGCGMGKTYVGSELVRRSRARSVVVTQHATSVEQWARHLAEEGRLPNVATLAEAREGWANGGPRKADLPLPDVLVLTYQSVARASSWARSVREASERGDASPGHEEGGADHRLVLAAMCDPGLGVLVLDEVHVAVAEHFEAACAFPARVRYGLTGSLVREDDRLGRLLAGVGKVLHCDVARQRVAYRLVRVPVPPRHARLLAGMRKRGKAEHAVRTLNPAKVACLAGVLAECEAEGRRVIVFCDSFAAAGALSLLERDARRREERFLLLRGGVADEERCEVLRRFATTRSAVLVATRVCDAAIDFPDGCVVVQMHVSSGSRQQEVQRCGRGSRSGGEGGVARVVHLVNEGTEEEGFVARRVGHVRALLGEAATVTEERAEERAAVREGGEGAPLASLHTIRLGKSSRRGSQAKWARALVAR